MQYSKPCLAMIRVYVIVIAVLLLAIEAAGGNRNPQTIPPNSASSQAVSSHPAVSGNGKLNPRDNYVGDDACRGCHQDKVESFHRTAHSLTSALPDKDSILGSFSPDANVLKTSNPDLFFRV